MGGDKALMEWPLADGGTVPLFIRAAQVLDGFCERVEISVGSRGPRPGIDGAAWPTFPDALEGAGPLAGLAAGLGRAADLGLDGVLALACDMPFVDESDFAPLLALLREGADVALWTVEAADGKVWDQPLVAAYSVACAPAVREALSSGARRLVAIEGRAAANGRQVAFARLPASENSSLRLVNVNTPSDYDSARSAAVRLSSESGSGSPWVPGLSNS